MNIDTYEGPSPADLEQAEHGRYAAEFETLVSSFRIALETTTPTDLVMHTSRLCGGHVHVLSNEQPVIYFHDRWGYPAVLRALAKAIAQPAHILGNLEGD